MGLEPGDAFGVACLADRLHFLAHSHLDGEILEILVHKGAHARVHGEGKEQHHIVVFAIYDVFHVQKGVEHSEQSCQSGIRLQEAVGIERLQSHQTLLTNSTFPEWIMP